MKIKFYCKNHCADFEKTEEELKSEKVITHCAFCGEKLRIMNLDEVVKQDIYTQAKEYLDRWVRELGLEGCIELVERHKNQACYRIYKEILKERGFKLK